MTLGATNQGMVAGDLVNTASRLQSVAPPGTVLVGEVDPASGGEAITFEPAGEQLSRVSAPVAAWRALRVVAERGGRDRRDALEAPFVGRDDELRLLKELFHATGAGARARLVSVIGPAGIGKTRLAWEFLKYLDGLVETVWWHDGRSPAYGEGISFWALGEMVRRRCGLLETDDEATTRAEGRRDRRGACPGRGRATLDRAGAPRAARDRGGACPRTSCSGPGGRSSSGSRRRHRWRSSSRTTTTPTRACSTSSTTSSSGAGTAPSTS